MHINGVLETAIYATDLDAAESFYTRVLGLELIARVHGRHVFFRVGKGVFLVFNPDATSTSSSDKKNSIPGHGTHGPGHVAFSVEDGDLDAWRERLAEKNVAIESDVRWPNGSRSLYFRDPAGNSIEIATPALWGLK